MFAIQNWIAIVYANVHFSLFVSCIVIYDLISYLFYFTLAVFLKFSLSFFISRTLKGMQPYKGPFLAVCKQYLLIYFTIFKQKTFQNEQLKLKHDGCKYARDCANLS